LIKPSATEYGLMLKQNVHHMAAGTNDRFMVIFNTIRFNVHGLETVTHSSTMNWFFDTWVVGTIMFIFGDSHKFLF